MNRLKLFFYLIPFVITACSVPGSSNVNASTGGVESPTFDNVGEVAGPNGSLWKGVSSDGRYHLTFSMKQDGWTGVLRIEDSQAQPWEDMRKYEAIFDGTSIKDGNIVVFNVKYATNGWKVEASLKVTAPGKGFGNVHIKENNFKLIDVPVTQTKN